jgi:hypothetical protein
MKDKVLLLEILVRTDKDDAELLEDGNRLMAAALGAEDHDPLYIVSYSHGGQVSVVDREEYYTDISRAS